MSAILELLGPTCRDTHRRALIAGNPALNGIDFVEYERQGAEDVLVVRFMPGKQIPTDAWGLPGRLSLVRIEGGARIAPITPLGVTRAGDEILKIVVSRQGDFSTYWLALGWTRAANGGWRHEIDGIDRPFSVAPIAFRAGCPVDFDCVAPAGPVTPSGPEPALDYLAKDFASFRQLLLDLIAQRNPGWLERSPADLGMALVELLAYEGDHLSYFQDAVANEAYLDTARQRVSVKRHAQLVDYRMHDGRNAWTFVHIAVDSAGTLAPGQKVLTRITAPVRSLARIPLASIEPGVLSDAEFETDPALARVQVFETRERLVADPANNTILFHTWGNQECCLPPGTTTVHVWVRDATAQTAALPVLAKGDWLIFEEVLGPLTGDPADADPLHRQAVRLDRDPVVVEDRAYAATLQEGRLRPWAGTGPTLRVVEVTFRREHALTFPLCLAARRADGTALRDVSVARGNVVLADHGRTVTEVLDRHGRTIVPGTPFTPSPVPDNAPFRLPLGHGPLTMSAAPATDAARTADEIDADLRKARPDITLRTTAASGQIDVWEARPALLGSRGFDPHFVIDADDDGRATLRFGDGEYGRAVTGATIFEATYRVGNGRPGNVGAEALVHLVLPPPSPEVGAPLVPGVIAVRNPLAARDGTERETIEEVRQYAPAAFRARQLRAVTEADYVQVVRDVEGVAGGAATFRWTGSWYTVYVAIDPRDAGDLVEGAGGPRLSTRLEARVRERLDQRRLAGYDVEIRAARYVPLEVDVEVCVASDYFRGDVGHAVVRALAGRGGRADAFFHPDHFTFGRSVYLSRLYAAIEAVEGVDSAVVTRFHRFGRSAAGEREAGVLSIAASEIARLDNDVNAMENGVLRVTPRGGK